MINGLVSKESKDMNALKLQTVMKGGKSYL